MSKKFKTRKIKVKVKYTNLRRILYIIVIIFSCNLVFNYLISTKIDFDNSTLVSYLIKSSNNIVEKNISKSNIINKLIKLFGKIDITSPITMFENNITKSNIKVENDSDDNYENMQELEKVSKYIENPNPSKIDNPILYIYNSHQLENYSAENLESYNVKPNVMLTSYILKENLEKSNIESYVEETNINELLRVNNWSGAQSYKASRLLIEDAIKKYSSLKYFIDIHRDSVSREYTTLNVDNINYAKFYFVIGLENQNYKYNMEFASKLDQLLNSKVKNISKGILAKQGKDVNGIYNQDINKNLLLIEVGGVDNTIDEIKRSTELLSEVLIQYINGDKNET